MRLYTGREKGIQVRASIKLLLWLTAGTGTLLAVLVALLYFVDVNLYRDRIEQQVSTAFGREVILEGTLSLEPSLSPRFTVNGLKISNPDWASRPFLAVVDKFDIRISLLPLLRGDLEIIRLEFHGVDLLLEEATDGDNNFTFGGTGEAAALPSIESMSLHDASIAYATPGNPVRRLHLAQVTARKVPGQPVELDAHTTLNALPVTISLRGEPRDDGQPNGPWRVTLLGESGGISLRVEGSLADPADWHQGEYRLELSGRHLDNLETLTGVTLPEAGPYKLGANIRFSLNDYLTVSDLSAQLDDTDISGSLHWDMSTSPPAIKLRLDSQHIDARDVGGGEPLPGDVEQESVDYWDQPLDTSIAGAVDLDMEVRIQQLDGLEKPLQDIVLTAFADREQLRFAVDRATMEDTHITAEATVPWGERLTALAPQAVSLKTLLQHARLDVRAQAPGAIHRYEAILMGEPFAIELSSVELTARPDSALMIRAEAALDDKPVTVKLQGEPLATLLQHPTGPWPSLALEVRGDDIRLDASGSVAHPLEAGGFDIKYVMSSPDIAALLPLQGAWSLTGHYADQPDRHVFDDLKITLGESDIGGRIVLHLDEPRPRLSANLNSGQLHVDEILPDNAGETSTAASLNQPLDVGGLGAIDLDIDVRIRRLEGLEKPVQNVLLTAHADGRSLTLAPLQGTIEGVRLDARVRLPWGERLAALGKNGLSITQLAQHADLELQAQSLDGKLNYQADLMGQTVALALGTFEASVRPGEALRVDAKATIDDKPVQLNLQAEPLAKLLQRPAGPWQHLALDIQGDDISLQASGSVKRPLEAKGFDIQYALQGAEIETLLPLFNVILTLEGAYSLTGHFADLPDRIVFDELKITAGKSDIGGRISVYQGEQRPKVVAHLHSEKIYLGELLPVDETEPVAETEPVSETEHRVIPDYNLPIERMREIDGELHFKGKRLRTIKGDLGDINFTATLQDGVFRLDPFKVRGWGGALIESDGTIDASQDPPAIALQWTARQLNYGLLLEQAGFAETVEGMLDITLRLSGNGRTRHEFLGNADGQLIIVGQQGKFGSRRLDLWGSDLVTTMLSRDWRKEDVTDLNCLVARIRIEDGIASSDDLLVDTQRITIGAAGTLDLESEELNLVFAPRPKRTSLVSLTNPVRITGTLVAPEVEVTVLPRGRMAAAGGGLLAGLVNPGYLLFTFSQTGSGQTNACAAAVEEAMVMKGRADELDAPPSTASPKRFSLLPGCSPSRQSPVH
jgi:uncharacterized protein involved in outer membrane biogenesis